MSRKSGVNDETSNWADDSGDVVESLNEMAESIEENTGRKSPDEHWLVFGDTIVDIMLENDWIDPTPDEGFAGRVNRKLHEDMAEALLEMDEGEEIPLTYAPFRAFPVIPPIGTKVYRNKYIESDYGQDVTGVMCRESDLIDFHKDDFLSNHFRE